ncbi:endolytic transglycosylase MltG [Mahella sp.]|uniref:endolytic transglycosylase MltG n=1 Tax=Mahella sp. TaxID=2798721 RepID=UPI0025C4FBFE|nr:endolytic transglycosylase MltG [Mahella sp.]
MPEIMTDEKQMNNSLPQPRPWWKKTLSQAAIFLISLAIVLGGLTLAGWELYQHYFGPMDPGSDEIIEVEIPLGSSTTKIANILEENKLVRSATVFRYYVDFSGNSDKLKAGIYKLKPSMTMSQMLEEMLTGKAMAATKTFTVVPGSTVEGMANSLVKQGLIKDTKRFLELAKSDEFDSYWFIADIENADKRRYKLEGYLYPDTYQVYANADEEQIITKMLDQFEKVFSEEYRQRAQELNMTVDQVVTLASIIEKEAGAKDFAKVSAVFHNRIKKDMPLQSCATISYVKGQTILFASSSDIKIESPYNTYKYKGLPAGPISNPGKNAIQAALYPEQSFIDQYYYFAVSDPDTKETVYSKTLEEHNKVVAKYRDVWLEWQKEHSDN